MQSPILHNLLSVIFLHDGQMRGGLIYAFTQSAIKYHIVIKG